MVKMKTCVLYAFICLALSQICANAESWTPAWDSLIIRNAIAKYEKSFDKKALMLTEHVGPGYRYHTNLRDMDVHPTRSTFRYALALLEAGGKENVALSAKILNKVIALQDTVDSSTWYGLWGYYLEEPAHKMSPADWNWADFNCKTLLIAYHRHKDTLPKELVAKIKRAILHAGRSVRRRNVNLHYTNIAVMGTFITLASAELLDDKDLWNYAVQRLRKLCRTVDQSGSFFEYNSPTYGRVSIANLTLLRMFVKDSLVRARADRLHHRVWLQLAKHWHAPTQQLAGPMSRAYHTDVGKPLWLQKALGGKLQFATQKQVQSGEVKGSDEEAILDFRCPEDLQQHFLMPGKNRLHREAFSLGNQYPDPFFAEGVFKASSRKKKIGPVQGTTYLTAFMALGSVNKGDFWVQRRQLLAYWGSSAQPVNYLRARFVKDDYDFASAMFYSVQNDNCVLGTVVFRSDGGDKHLTLDPVKDGAFKASKLYLEFIVNGWNKKSQILAAHKKIGVSDSVATLGAHSRLALQSGGAHICISVPKAVFGEEKPEMTAHSEDGKLFIRLFLMDSDSSKQIEWQKLKQAGIAFTVQISKARGSIEQFDKACAKQPWREKAGTKKTRFSWQSPAGKLSVSVGTTPVPVVRLDELFEEKVKGEPVPMARLSKERLAW